MTVFGAWDSRFFFFPSQNGYSVDVDEGRGRVRVRLSQQRQMGELLPDHCVQAWKHVGWPFRILLKGDPFFIMQSLDANQLCPDSDQLCSIFHSLSAKPKQLC